MRSPGCQARTSSAGASAAASSVAVSGSSSTGRSAARSLVSSPPAQAVRPGTESGAGVGGSAPPRSNRRRPYSTTARRPPPTSSGRAPAAARRARGSPRSWDPPRAGGRRRGRRAAAPRAARARAAGRPAARPRPGLARARRPPPSPAPPPRRAGRRACASTLASAAGCTVRNASSSALRIAVARERVGPVALVLAPGQPAGAAVRGRLLARDPEQRAHEPPRARRHAEQRPAAGRGGEPVQHGLDLVGRRVAGGRDAAAAQHDLGGGRVALVARPGLEVAGVGRLRMADLERDLQARAQLGAVGLVRRRRVAQPVVDVQRRDGVAPSQAQREVEQAHGVAPARQQDGHGRARREQARRSDALLDSRSGHGRLAAASASRRPPRQVELSGLAEALELDLADALEREAPRRRVDHRPRHEHLAAGRPRADPRGEVDGAAVVVAVAIERGTAVHADARQRALVVRGLEGHRPVGQRAGVRADDHHLVADRLDHARVRGKRVGDVLDEALDDPDRLLLPGLLGQPRVAGEVGERDRHVQAAEVELASRPPGGRPRPARRSAGGSAGAGGP